ncbi:helix-turn-helix domain-containing protein [Streptomyces sp. NPDC098789]|uniref:helix-turn-helix domain-containing protein n=1 Tax=Streptomyces sp. NPDC098789 TaxID=3366098 RepID=UPI003819D633
MYDPEKSRARRIKLGMTVAELAKRAGVSERSTFRYEAGEAVPSVDKFVRIAAALHVPFSSLLRQGEDNTDVYAALFGAEMARRRNASAHIISTDADARQAVEIDQLVTGIRRVQKGAGHVS